jgi:D-inositol-3-phosphate glycosyltransferase
VLRSEEVTAVNAAREHRTHPKRSGSRRPTIGLVVPALHEEGGVARVAEFLCNVIERQTGFDWRIVSLSAAARDMYSVGVTRPKSWISGIRSAPRLWRGRPCTVVGAFASEFEFQRFRPRRALRAALADCDLVQVVSGTPAFAYAVSDLGKPVSLQCATLARAERHSRECSGWSPMQAWRRSMTAITARYETAALRSVHAVQVENAWMLAHVEAIAQGAVVQYAPPGLDTDRFAPAQERSLDGGYILAVGRFADPRKNPRLLLDAYSYLSSETRAQFRLLLAGATPPPDEFWLAVAHAGLEARVQFIGNPTDAQLVALYQGAACFALSSDEEGLGLVLLEAMACGVPAVATRCGGPDGIITDECDGFLVRVGAVREMAHRLNDLLLDAQLNRRLGLRARQTIQRRYCSRVAAKPFLETWAQLLALRRTS